MSIEQVCDSVSSNGNDAYSTRKRAPGRNKPAQLATRTKSSLDDILGEAEAGRADLRAIWMWIEYERIQAKGRYDLCRLERLGEFSQLVGSWALRVGAIERLAADARVGEYHGPPGGKS